MGGACVAKLIATAACSGLLPRTIGDVILTEVALGPVTSIAPFAGQTDAVTRALLVEGLHFPSAGETVTSGRARLIWVGQGRALLCGVEPPVALTPLAAVTDQSDANAVVQIDGAAAIAVLARLVPVDLRDAAFVTGQTRRTMLGHMMASVTKTGPATFEVMVMRSMAGTLVHDLTEAAIGVEARG